MMLALRLRTEVILRALLAAVILFNALVPTAKTAEAKQESVAQLSESLPKIEQENRSIPTFERPEPRVGYRQLRYAGIDR
jgi:hypothetical protein